MSPSAKSQKRFPAKEQTTQDLPRLKEQQQRTGDAQKQVTQRTRNIVGDGGIGWLGRAVWTSVAVHLGAAPGTIRHNNNSVLRRKSTFNFQPVFQPEVQ